MADLSPQDEADLAALADGRLPAERRAALEARLEADPDLADALDAQRRAAQAVAAVASQVHAPHDLRLRVDALATAPRRRSRRPRWLPLGGLVAAAAAVAFGVVLAGGGGLTVQDALAAATRPPTGAVAPGPAPQLLDEEIDGVVFPDYAAKFGWRAVGRRADTIEGRRTETVFYERGGRRIAYTIVAGDPLERPDERVDGVPLRSFGDEGRTVVTWLRQDHTCVLSGEDVGADVLTELAVWKGQGAVEF